MGVLNRFFECEYVLGCSDDTYEASQSVCEANGDTWGVIKGTTAIQIPAHANDAAFFVKNGSGNNSCIISILGSCDGENWFKFMDSYSFNIQNSDTMDIDANESQIFPLLTYPTAGNVVLPMYVRLDIGGTDKNLGTDGKIFFAYSSI